MTVHNFKEFVRGLLCVFILYLILSLGVGAIRVSAQPSTDHHAFGAPKIGYERVTSDYTALYHPVYQIPLWASYKVESYVDDKPNQSRISPFKSDTFAPLLPSYAILKHKDYTNSGFDRGQMFPHAAAEQGGLKVVKESYRMTNVCPQTKDLNQYLWKWLEKQVRDWAKDHNGVWVITGPIMAKYDEQGPMGRTKKNSTEHYNEERNPYFYSKKNNQYIVIPIVFYKIIINRIGSNTEIIAFVMPQEIDRVYSLVNAKLRFPEYIVTVDDIEQLTGINFLPDISDESLESTLPNSQQLTDVWGLSWPDDTE